METNTFPLELLTNDNYEDLSAKMKNYLLAQGLWDIVETGSKPPKADDDVVQYEAWIKMNDAALRTIQSSCGMDILSQINKISSAKIFWIMLGKMFMESNGQDELIQIEDYDSIIDKQNSSSLDKIESSGHDKLIQTEDVDSIIDEENSSSLDNMESSGHDKLIQTEDVDSIIDEENSSSSDNTGQEREDDYADLVKAVQSRDWITARDFLKLHPATSTTRITVAGGTVLHAAVEAEQECIVEELVNMISEHDLAMQYHLGVTALHFAITSGNQRMAECLITKNKSLVSIRNIDGYLPVTLAMVIGHKELAHYLYSQTPFEDLGPDRDGAKLLIGSIYNRDLDMALDLMKRCPRLAFALGHGGNTPWRVLAISTEAFKSENRLVFWKRWIYNHLGEGIHILLDRAADQFCLHIQNYQEETIGSVSADHLWRQLVLSLLNLLGFKRLYEMKLVRAQFQQLLSRMCEAIPTITSPEKQYDITSPLINLAISRGNFEFVCQILKANSSLQWIFDDIERRNMFYWAVVHRQHRIFSLAYNLKKRNYLLNGVDNSNNSILHLEGMLPKYSPIDHIRGAALQMRRKVQWFKVEGISPPFCSEGLNNDGLIAKQLFMKEHQDLRKDGEKWMKGTATSCTVVGALIITIMFAATFTIPGGNKQDTGLPIFVHDKLFKLFIVADSLSLFSSSTSVLMFSRILTSRYAEEDFLISLPKKMIIGLFALFFSIATMMIAFSAALLLMLSGKYWIVVPIIGLAGVPIILFVLMQFHLLIDMLGSTNGSGIFDRKMKL